MAYTLSLITIDLDTSKYKYKIYIQSYTYYYFFLLYAFGVVLLNYCNKAFILKRIKDTILFDSLSGRNGNICVLMNADRKPVCGLKLIKNTTILLSDFMLSRYTILYIFL